MKKFAFIFTLVASCLGSSLAFAGTQSGPSSPTTNATASVENNGSKTEKQTMTDNCPKQKAGKQAKQDSKLAGTARPLTPEEQEWEKTVYNP